VADEATTSGEALLIPTALPDGLLVNRRGCSLATLAVNEVLVVQHVGVPRMKLPPAAAST
jgi:hypothetical protein